MPPWLLALLLLAAVGAGLAGSAAAAGTTGGDGHPGEGAPDGEHLFLRDCASCHAPSGLGTERGVALDRVGPAGTYYVLSTGRMPISRPGATIGRSDPRYSAAEIDAMVEHVRELVGGPELPDVDLDAAGLARGGEVYRLECAACHGATGTGGALAFEGYAPSLLHATPAQTAAAIVTGPGSMPTFRGQLSDEDLAAVAAYVQLLHDPPSTGVEVPGSRVGEGLVAWVAGVGGLVLAARWIGTRR